MKRILKEALTVDLSLIRNRKAADNRYNRNERRSSELMSGQPRQPKDAEVLRKIAGGTQDMNHYLDTGHDEFMRNKTKIGKHDIKYFVTQAKNNAALDSPQDFHKDSHFKVRPKTREGMVAVARLAKGYMKKYKQDKTETAQNQITKNLDRDDKIRSEFPHHQTERDLIVYHGLSLPRARRFTEDAERAGGKPFNHHFQSYRSTSRSFDTAKIFSHADEDADVKTRHIIAIKVPKGSHAINIYRDFPGNSWNDEQELFLHKNGVVRVRANPTTFAFHNGNKIHVWHATLTHDGIKDQG